MGEIRGLFETEAGETAVEKRMYSEFAVQMLGAVNNAIKQKGDFGYLVPRIIWMYSDGSIP